MSFAHARVKPHRRPEHGCDGARRQVTIQRSRGPSEPPGILVQQRAGGDHPGAAAIEWGI